MKTQLDLYRPRDSWRRVCCREAHPVKDEMSVATPKTHAREPIQLDIIVVCRKRMMVAAPAPSRDEAISAARCKIERMHAAGFNLSRNDQKIILFGQLLTTVRFDRRRPRVFRCSTRLCSYRIFAIHRDAPTFFVRIKTKTLRVYFFGALCVFKYAFSRASRRDRDCDFSKLSRSFAISALASPSSNSFAIACSRSSSMTAATPATARAPSSFGRLRKSLNVFSNRSEFSADAISLNSRGKRRLRSDPLSRFSSLPRKLSTTSRARSGRVVSSGPNCVSSKRLGKSSVSLTGMSLRKR